jgi:hypothetical protein
MAVRGLGVPSAAGRLLVEDDDRPGAPQRWCWRMRTASVISMATQRRWEDRFGSRGSLPLRAWPAMGFSDSILKRIRRFSANPPDSATVPHPDAEQCSRFFDKNFYWLEMMIRLRPGVTLEQA